jgi:hypothetical protein
VSVVLADPEGFAVDWDWQRGLTVWAVAGPRSGSRFGTRVLDHQLLSAYSLTCRGRYEQTCRGIRAISRKSGGSWAASAKSFHASDIQDREAWLSLGPADRDSARAGSNAWVHPHPPVVADVDHLGLAFICTSIRTQLCT